VQNLPKLLIFIVFACRFSKGMHQLQPPCKILYHYNIIVAFTCEKKKAKKCSSNKRKWNSVLLFSLPALFKKPMNCGCYAVNGVKKKQHRLDPG